MLALVLLPGKKAAAQVCNGSLGDPVVNITFNNAGPSPYVPDTSYTYQAADCPNDGYYTVTNHTNSCFDNHWFTVTSDHTGNGGNFMLVNASYAPGVFFVTTVTDLCPNTTYEFSAWVMSVLNTFGINPDLLFTIEKPDGTMLGSYETGLIPNGSQVWEKYGLLFSTPSDNATIVLRIRNNSPGGNGNDLALDDIGFRPCGSKITATIQSNKDTVDVCEGNTNQYVFSATVSSDYQSPYYQWQESNDSGQTWQDINGATTNAYLRLPTLQPGKYGYRLTVVEASHKEITSCRIASNVLHVNVHPNPLVDAGPDRIFITGYPVTILASASGEHISYYWQPASYLDNPDLLTPVATPPADMLYKLVVKSAFNCAGSDEMKITSVKGLYIPNAFTPNGDGINDTWHIPYLDIGLNAEVKIYNRWGQLIYRATASAVSWNGAVNGIPQPAGAYVYLVTFRDNKLKPIKGLLTLIR